MNSSYGSGKYDVDFSLALRNRTGKYVVGRQILADQAERIDKVYYWRVPLPSPPERKMARLIELTASGVAQAERILGRSLLPPLRPRNPVLHLDPYTVQTAQLRSDDIVLVHDMGPITHPTLFHAGVPELYADAFRRIAAAAPRLVFVSKASRDAYIALYGTVPDMRVIYNPVRSELGAKKQEPIAGIEGPFLLTVGSLGERKNQRRSIEAFAQSGLADKGVSYVLCGAREPGADAVEAAARATSGVILLSFVSDAQLVWLYANARGFVLMSLLEGFGMPVAEAIARGLVPLVSEGTVLEEVAGPGALTALNTDTDVIAQAMLELVHMPDNEQSSRRTALTCAIAAMDAQAFQTGWHNILNLGYLDVKPEKS